MSDPHVVPGASPAGASPAAPPPGRGAMAAGAVLALVFLLGAAGLIALAVLGRSAASGPGSSSPPPPAGSMVAAIDAPPAPPLALTDQDGNPFELASLLGRPVLVFFGYTHCPDVCPETVGIINEVLAQAGDGPRAVFVSIDPERDDVAAMKSYLRYLPAAYTGLSGSAAEIRANADAWGVRYARQETGSPDGYAMSHTADVFLVDGLGRLRAAYPFGTQAGPIAAGVTSLLAELPVAAASPSATAAPPASGSPSATPVPPPTAAPTPSAAPAVPGATVLYPEVVSTSIWAGATDPVILRASDAAGRPLGVDAPLTVRLTTFDGTPAADPVVATPVLPEGEDRPYFIAPLTIPSAGAWRLQLESRGARGDILVQAMDPGATTPIGAPAPDIDTPTLDDVGGIVRAVTTEPNPDLRLSTTSTADARAMGKPYVIVIDSSRFKVSPECGRALTMIRYLLDRWEDEVVFIHLEPFEYQVITSEPVLSGTLTNPPMNRFARAWGLGDATWPAVKVPWIFVVDGDGLVRAKYTGLVGTADIDVVLTQVTGGAQS